MKPQQLNLQQSCLYEVQSNHRSNRILCGVNWESHQVAKRHNPDSSFSLESQFTKLDTHLVIGMSIRGNHCFQNFHFLIRSNQVEVTVDQPFGIQKTNPLCTVTSENGLQAPIWWLQWSSAGSLHTLHDCSNWVAWVKTEMWKVPIWEVRFYSNYPPVPQVWSRQQFECGVARCWFIHCTILPPTDDHHSMSIWFLFCDALRSWGKLVVFSGSPTLGKCWAIFFQRS